MNTPLSTNTQAILLLTAPLISGRAEPSLGLLTPGEYKRLARHLHQMGREPADLLSAQVDSILRDSIEIVETTRILRLLGRGFALSQAIERWRSRAIWVVSRADPEYPQRLRDRLKEDRPAILYGCGERSILDSRGLAVVGSRNVDDVLIEYTQNIGRLVAKARKTLVSGGARGIDQAAMRGALEAGGKASGVMADSLEKTAMSRENRSLLMDGQLVLVSPYDPGAGFNVGNAMQRNKLIYALADAALVVNSDYAKGGTWNGAVEQLDKLRLVPMFIRSSGAKSKGLDALRDKGAMPWPNPEDSNDLDQVFAAPTPALVAAANAELQDPLFGAVQASPAPEAMVLVTEPQIPVYHQDACIEPLHMDERPSLNPADSLFVAVRHAIFQLLAIPRKESEIAAELQIKPAQAKEWLQRLITEGAVEKGPKKSLFQRPGRLL